MTSATFVRIAELPAHAGQNVVVRAWVTHLRSSGKIAFAVLRDGTGICQTVFVKNQLPPEAWERFAQLTTETSVEISGEVRIEPRAPGGAELGVTSLTIIGASPIDYPIQPKEHGVDFLLDNRHFWLRSPRQRAIAVIRSEIEQAIHDFFYENGFLRVDTPILTAAIGERSGLFATEYFDLGNAYLAQTGQLYGEAAAAAFGKIYTFGPTFRAEKSKTRRHLTEFWMIEPEVAWNDSEANMKLQEDFVSFLVQRVLERRKAELLELERDVTKLENIKPPFPRLNYTDAIALVQSKGSDAKWGDDLGAEDEALIVADYDKPVFVFNYPKEESLLHEGESGRSAHGALRRPAGAGRLRRDDRRFAARGRLRQARGAHQGRGAADGCVRVVSGSTPLRDVHALRIWAWPGADGRVDLRDSAYPRGDRVSANDAQTPTIAPGQNKKATAHADFRR